MPTVNVADLLQESLGLSRKECAAIARIVTEPIMLAVARGEKVDIGGFGVFEAVGRKPTHRPGQEFKAVVSGSRASGIVVPSPGDGDLDAPRPHSAESGGQGSKSRAGKGTKQAWQNDPVRRKAVEDHAQDMLEKKYRRAGWTVTDTRFGSPYDAIAKKGKETLYLEAKGTESDGRSVLVTAGEVRWAEQHPDECVLGVVSGISFDAFGNLDRTSGTLTEYTWSPTSGQLEAKTYVWTPPTP